ncbi:hypothetical protein [uncultured Cohaesibacter sp.]|uniref:hypothetical protein n=1 Tax=uncultured Cohaesibacter sp. TaxID=1002546 RepID=UPI0029C93DF8|nr:hypothetical protein [uncultured Cohaesibacter sp.]
MREIEGIEEAMEVLRPHWGAIEDNFNQQNERYLAMAASDHDVVGRVLRVHLIIENFMNSYLVDFYGFEDYNNLRLSFSQKATMLPKSSASAAWVRPGIIQLNAVRNKYGHRLDHKVEFPDISAIIEVLSVSRSGSQFSTPIDAIEAFAPVACAFLSVPPPHLSNEFKEAFRYVYITTPVES